MLRGGEGKGLSRSSDGFFDKFKYLVSSSKFKCNFSYAKKAFYRSFNAIFGRVVRLASEEVVFHLIKAKCLPVIC